MAYPFIEFVRPNGEQRPGVMTLIKPADEDWLRENNVKISLEDLGIGICIYADYGAKDSDGEPDEHMLIVPRSGDCKSSMSLLVVELKELKNGKDL